ncbi:MAG: rod shape-determining protein RodA [Acidobacteria bacterium]|nr:rod shape-determining protein RodA [Acidobacteriota bacterium]
MRLDRRMALSFDWLWFLSLLLLSAAGLTAIWSTTQGTGLSDYLGRQAIYICLSLLVFMVLLYFDYHVYSDYVSIAYLAGLLVLVLVLVIGRTVNANRSWLSLGFFAFQPSELMKVLVICFLAKYYAEIDRDTLEVRDLVTGGLITAIPMALVMLQGDLGTAVTFLPIYAGLSFLGGLKRKHILVLLLATAVILPAGWIMLKDYQKGRIQTVLNPSSDPQGMGYQPKQSKIAIGSGGFLGKGFKQGTQGQLGFLPARHTDFVFAVISEERGFLGSISLLGLFLFVLFRLLRAGREAKDKIGAMIPMGVFSLFLFHVVINAGMNMGLLPIAGIPLPFVSAGGSSLLSFFAGMGLAMNVSMRRFVN